MNTVLTKSFFKRSAPIVAQELLGKYLVRKGAGKETILMITETEAYEGPCDTASHAHAGKTRRNTPMFADAGIFYVYLCYGMYWMLNVVTGEEGYPAAVLIRGTEGVKGPGRVTKYLSINKNFTGEPASRKTGLWFEDRGTKIQRWVIKRTPRIGVEYAGKKWAKKPWRFVLFKKI